VFGAVRFCGSILLGFLLVLSELLLGRETDLLDMEGRDGGLTLFELLRELDLLPELLEDDRELDLDDLPPLFDARTGSTRITTPSIIISTKFRLNPASFIIKSRTNYS
jgi:hypothetical protein